MERSGTGEEFFNSHIALLLFYILQVRIGFETYLAPQAHRVTLQHDHPTVSIRSISTCHILTQPDPDESHITPSFLRLALTTLQSMASFYCHRPDSASAIEETARARNCSLPLRSVYLHLSINEYCV